MPSASFEFASSGLDGVHLALWIDDVKQSHEPFVVLVRPMTLDPQRIVPIAHSAAEFLHRVEAKGLNKQFLRLLPPDGRPVCLDTLDQLGVWTGDPMRAVDRIDRPDRNTLEVTEPQGESLTRWVKSALDTDPALALAIVRDAIAVAWHFPGLAELAGKVYEALGRPTHAAIARVRFAQDEKEWLYEAYVRWSADRDQSGAGTSTRKEFELWCTDTPEGRRYCRLEREEARADAEHALGRHLRKRSRRDGR